MTELSHSVLGRLHLSHRLPVAGAAAFGSVMSGWLVAHGHASATLVACIVAVTLLALVTTWNAGVSIGLLLLVVMNGVPIIDLQLYVVAGFRLSDLAVIVLTAGLAIRIHARGMSGGSTARHLAVWSAMLSAWWLIVLLRTTLFEDVPLLKAFLFGRDFIYFAILLPLLAMALRGRDELIGCIGTLLAGALVFSTGQLAISAAGASSNGWASWFVHAMSVSEAESEGVSRVYASMGDAVAPTVAFGLGLALMPPSRRLARAIGIVLFVVGAIAMLYLFTRALYIGSAIALLLAMIIWLFGARALNAARRGVAVLCMLLLIVVVAIQYDALTTSVSGANAASARASSTLAELDEGRGNLSYRVEVIRDMLDILDSGWVAGLGFLHPESRPVPGLPDESIRNGDVGVMNSLMTMGAVGTSLLYIAPFAILLAVVRRWRALPAGDQQRDNEWFFFGTTMWVTVALVTSLSLVTLFSVSGIVMSAVLLACTARWLDETVAEPDDALGGVRR